MSLEEEALRMTTADLLVQIGVAEIATQGEEEEEAG
jgi:hypothetical protein